MLHGSLPEAVRERYARHLVLPEIGPDGHARLGRARVLVIGAGGLGCAVLTSLAAAGVGRLTALDPGRVARSDLPRQTLYRPADVGRPKAEAAAERLAELEPDGRVVGQARAFEPAGGRAWVRDHDLVVDASDNPATRYLASDACVLEGRPLAFGAVVRSDGQVARLAGPSAPCYRCLFPHPPGPEAVASCAEVGILAPAAAAIGAMVASQVLLFLAGGDGTATAWTSLFVHADLAEGRFVRLSPPRDPSCRACGPDATLRELRLERAALAGGEPFPGAATPEARGDVDTGADIG